MGHMKFEHTQPYENWFWEKNRIELKKGYVKTVETKSKSLHFADGDTLQYDKLVIATGSKPNKFGWPGQDLDGVMGMYHKQDLDKLEKYAPNKETCKRAVIVGGGIGLYAALSARNPSPAIGWASAILPALTFVGITGFLQGNTLQVLLVVAVAYGFTTVALLVPAIGAFDLLTGRSSTGDA